MYKREQSALLKRKEYEEHSEVEEDEEKKNKKEYTCAKLVVPVIDPEDYDIEW